MGGCGCHRSGTREEPCRKGADQSVLQQAFRAGNVCTAFGLGCGCAESACRGDGRSAVQYADRKESVSGEKPACGSSADAASGRAFAADCASCGRSYGGLPADGRGAFKGQQACVCIKGCGDVSRIGAGAFYQYDGKQRNGNGRQRRCALWCDCGAVSGREGAFLGSSAGRIPAWCGR